MRAVLFVWMALTFSVTQPTLARQSPVTESIVELDPFDPNVEEILEEYDRVYEEETGLSSHLPDVNMSFKRGCYRASCRVWVLIDKSQQFLTLYIDGSRESGWLVSTGRAPRTTPDFDTHPNGRIYTRYTSTRYPEGDYQGLGNMPYAVFISGGFALHGTPAGNWRRLGTPASHGCIRMLPDNARYLNQLIRQVGIRNTWITVQ